MTINQFRLTAHTVFGWKTPLSSPVVRHRMHRYNRCRNLLFNFVHFLLPHAELQTVRPGVVHINDNAGEIVRAMQAYRLVAGQWP